MLAVHTMIAEDRASDRVQGLNDLLALVSLTLHFKRSSTTSLGLWVLLILIPTYVHCAVSLYAMLHTCRSKQRVGGLLIMYKCRLLANPRPANVNERVTE